MTSQLGHKAPLGGQNSPLQQRPLGTPSLSILDLSTFYPTGFPTVSPADTQSIQTKSIETNTSESQLEQISSAETPSIAAQVESQSVVDQHTSSQPEQSQATASQPTKSQSVQRHPAKSQSELAQSPQQNSATQAPTPIQRASQPSSDEDRSHKSRTYTPGDGKSSKRDTDSETPFRNHIQRYFGEKTGASSKSPSHDSASSLEHISSSHASNHSEEQSSTPLISSADNPTETSSQSSSRRSESTPAPSSTPSAIQRQITDYFTPSSIEQDTVSTEKKPDKTEPTSGSIQPIEGQHTEEKRIGNTSKETSESSASFVQRMIETHKSPAKISAQQVVPETNDTQKNPTLIDNAENSNELSKPSINRVQRTTDIDISTSASITATSTAQAADSSHPDAKDSIHRTSSESTIQRTSSSTLTPSAKDESSAPQSAKSSKQIAQQDSSAADTIQRDIVGSVSESPLHKSATPSEAPSHSVDTTAVETSELTTEVTSNAILHRSSSANVFSQTPVSSNPPSEDTNHTHKATDAGTNFSETSPSAIQREINRAETSAHSQPLASQSSTFQPFVSQPSESQASVFHSVDSQSPTPSSEQLIRRSTSEETVPTPGSDISNNQIPVSEACSPKTETETETETETSSIEFSTQHTETVQRKSDRIAPSLTSNPSTLASHKSSFNTQSTTPSPAENQPSNQPSGVAANHSTPKKALPAIKSDSSKETIQAKHQEPSEAEKALSSEVRPSNPKNAIQREVDGAETASQVQLPTSPSIESKTQPLSHPSTSLNPQRTEPSSLEKKISDNVSDQLISRSTSDEAVSDSTLPDIDRSADKVNGVAQSSSADIPTSEVFQRDTVQRSHSHKPITPTQPTSPEAQNYTHPQTQSRASQAAQIANQSSPSLSKAVQRSSAQSPAITQNSATQNLEAQSEPNQSDHLSNAQQDSVSTSTVAASIDGESALAGPLPRKIAPANINTSTESQSKIAADGETIQRTPEVTDLPPATERSPQADSASSIIAKETPYGSTSDTHLVQRTALTSQHSAFSSEPTANSSQETTVNSVDVSNQAIEASSPAMQKRSEESLDKIEVAKSIQSETAPSSEPRQLSDLSTTTHQPSSTHTLDSSAEQANPARKAAFRTGESDITILRKEAEQSPEHDLTVPFQNQGIEPATALHNTDTHEIAYTDDISSSSTSSLLSTDTVQRSPLPVVERSAQFSDTEKTIHRAPPSSGTKDAEIIDAHTPPQSLSFRAENTDKSTLQTSDLSVSDDLPIMRATESLSDNDSTNKSSIDISPQATSGIQRSTEDDENSLSTSTSSLISTSLSAPLASVESVSENQPITSTTDQLSSAANSVIHRSEENPWQDSDIVNSIVEQNSEASQSQTSSSAYQVSGTPPLEIETTPTVSSDTDTISRAVSSFENVDSAAIELPDTHAQTTSPSTQSNSQHSNIESHNPSINSAILQRKTEANQPGNSYLQQTEEIKSSTEVHLQRTEDIDSTTSSAHTSALGKTESADSNSTPNLSQTAPNEQRTANPSEISIPQVQRTAESSDSNTTAIADEESNSLNTTQSSLLANLVSKQQAAPSTIASDKAEILPATSATTPSGIEQGGDTLQRKATASKPFGSEVPHTINKIDIDSQATDVPTIPVSATSTTQIQKTESQESKIHRSTDQEIESLEANRSSVSNSTTSEPSGPHDSSPQIHGNTSDVPTTSRNIDISTASNPDISVQRTASAKTTHSTQPDQTIYSSQPVLQKAEQQESSGNPLNHRIEAATESISSDETKNTSNSLQRTNQDDTEVISITPASIPALIERQLAEQQPASLSFSDSLPSTSHSIDSPLSDSLPSISATTISESATPEQSAFQSEGSQLQPSDTGGLQSSNNSIQRSSSKNKAKTPSQEPGTIQSVKRLASTESALLSIQRSSEKEATAQTGTAPLARSHDTQPPQTEPSLPTEWSNLNDLVTQIENQTPPSTDTATSTQPDTSSNPANIQRQSQPAADDTIPSTWSNLSDLVSNLEDGPTPTSLQRSPDPSSNSTSQSKKPFDRPDVIVVDNPPAVTIQRTSSSLSQLAKAPTRPSPSANESHPAVTISRKSDSSEPTQNSNISSHHLELLAQEVYSLLRQRLSLEQERRGPKYPRP